MMLIRPAVLAALLSAVTPAWADAVLTSHGFTDLGDLAHGPDMTHLPYVNPEAPKGGEISLWMQGTFDTLNPYSRKGRAAALASAPFESLMTAVADDPYGAYCLLCSHIEYPESQDWVIFHLRPEARFSDGTPLTAEDVVFTVDLFLEQGLPSFREGVKKLYESVEALDATRVKFTFKDGIPRKGLISQAGSSVVFPKAWFDETGARLDETTLQFAPGSGPYKLGSYDINRQIVWERNPDYWGADLPISVGRYNFDSIRIEYFADSNAAFEAFKSGAYTFRQENSSLQWATAYNFPALDKDWVVLDQPANGIMPAATGFTFNLRRPLFQDKRVRQALGLMYNFTWTNETLQYGLFAQRDSFWQNSDLAAKGVPEGRELEYLESVADLIDPALLTDSVVMPHDSGARQLDRGNLRTASALLDEAGWIAGDDGIRRKDGQVLEVELLHYSPNFDRIINPYVQNLERLGVKAIYNRVDPSQYTTRTRDFDYDITFDFYRNGFEEGQGFAQKYGCEDAEVSLFNPAGFCHPAIDKLSVAILEAESLEDMQAAVRAADRIMRAEYFIVPVWYNDKYWLAYYDMFGRPEELPPLALGETDFWWFDADKAEALKAAGAFQ
ncbi:MAG: ABC transporter substrate-binding protein [Rhodobacterales bacterium]|nr:MAG: ABC transporter substrate-binding protein [Rhodobacterales bacterium]